MSNLILDVDSYKFSHPWLYPKHTKSMFSYVESRGGEFDKVCWVGLQMILDKLTQTVTIDQVEEAAQFCKAHGVPFEKNGWMRIATVHNGKIPVRIRAVPEGSVIPTHNVLMTVESTDPETFWSVGHIETMLMRVWYPTTVATLSWHIRRIIKEFLDRTADNPEAELPFKLHDFGARGVSSEESAAIGGAAHLLTGALGSDTVVGVRHVNKFYGGSMAGFSIPATEHSTITSWGREGEEAAYANLVEQFGKPGAILACVSDSYDLEHAVNELWGKRLREKVIHSGATVVIRPDSGDPTQSVMICVKSLADKYGTTVNSRGYKVLNNVRVIQGDGITLGTIVQILDTLEYHGYSAANIAFGMGGALLQKMDRDTLQFAYKCSSVTVGHEERDVYKDPVGSSFKKSKKGRLDLIHDGTQYKTVRLQPGEMRAKDSVMQVVYENGQLMNSATIEDVRNRALCSM